MMGEDEEGGGGIRGEEGERGGMGVGGGWKVSVVWEKYSIIFIFLIFCFLWYHLLKVLLFARRIIFDFNFKDQSSIVVMTSIVI